MTIKHLYPTTRPSLDLNFAQTKRLDPRVTFTRGSTATYVGSDGLIKTAASNEPRFDHDPETGESLGLLVEESRTNLLTYSEQVDQWPGNVAVTITPNAAISPDGSMNADRFQEDTANNRHQIRQTVTSSYTAGNKYCLTVFAKSGANDQVFIYFASSDFSFGQATFDLTNLTYNVAGAGVTAKITPFSNGWRKLEVTATAIATGTSIPIHIGRNDTFQVGDPNEDFYIWGAQLESGSFPTSYIPTAGTTATRAADVASMTGTNFSSWYNQSEGTMQMIFNASSLDTNTQFLGVGTTSSTKAGYVYRASTLYAVQATGSNNWSNTAVWLTTGIAVGNNRFAFGYSPGSNATVRNGSIQETNTETVIVQETSTTLYITQELTGTISRLTYYPTRLTDTQLQALTL